MAEKEEQQLPNSDELAESLNEFFTSVSEMIKSDLLVSFQSPNSLSFRLAISLIFLLSVSVLH